MYLYNRWQPVAQEWQVFSNICLLADDDDDDDESRCFAIHRQKIENDANETIAVENYK